MKPGIHTTEFLVTVFTLIGLLTASIVGSLPDKWGAIAGSISLASYNISRGLSKWSKTGV